MALQVNNYVGFETATDEEASSVTGSPTYNTSDQRSGGACLSLTSPLQYHLPFVVPPLTDQGGDYIIGVAVKPGAIDASSTTFFIQVRDSAGTQIFRLEIRTDDDVEIVDANDDVIRTIANPLSTSAYTYWEIYFQHSETGTIEVFIDGVSQGQDTNQDLANGNSLNSSADVTCRGPSGVSVAWLFDDVYILSGATSASDRLGGSGLASMPEVFGYQHSVGATAVPTAGISGNAATNLDNGTWANTVDADDGTSGEYEDANDGGSVDMDGPKDDATGLMVDRPVTATGATPFGSGDTTERVAYSFFPLTHHSVPTSIKLRFNKTGIPTDNVVVSIQGDNSGEPDDTDIVTFETIDISTFTGSMVTYELDIVSSAVLDFGVKYWVVLSRSGANDSGNRPNVAAYNDSDANTGRRYFDAPSWLTETATQDLDFDLLCDPIIDGDSNIRAVKGMWRLKRAGGGAAVHYIALGDSGDGNSPARFDDDADWGEITTAITNWFILKETDLPTAAQDIRMGFGKANQAGQDIFCYNMWSFLLHVPDAGAPPPSGPPIGSLALMGVGR